MALPKKKTAKARQGKRRSHMALSLPAIDYCPQCHSPKLAHHVCLTCGTYAGRQVLEVKVKKRE
ncbi:MAG: 50S ribosomal protein L32 [Dehalococcoidia bacterium]|nr:MAG: 50S ribosomal protein L32 [Dehalococcoidia bacterium]